MHLAQYHDAIVAAIVLIIIGAALVWYFRIPLPGEPSSPALPLPLEPIHLQFDPLHLIHASSRSLKDQSKEWRESLRQSGAILKANHVKEIILLHGTFVGSDPVNIISTMKSIFPKLGRFEDGMTKRMKGVIDQFAQDNGNFVPAYLELLEVALEAKIPVKLQFWSSANHHLARLEGALRLLEKVAQDFPQKPQDRILLIGHSHARQVFALFTQLVQGSGAKGSCGHHLWEIIERENLAVAGLRSKAKALRKQCFDFVTLGGPVRYRWAFVPNMRVLHIVNHSGDTSSSAQPWIFWKANSGDLVQQWGMIGSDSPAVTPRERTLNRTLDELLGKGWHTRLWLQSVVRRERLGDFGRTLLVDYQYMPAHKKNFLKTGFGHGIYTRFEVMHFQMELICKYIYSE